MACAALASACCAACPAACAWGSLHPGGVVLGLRHVLGGVGERLLRCGGRTGGSGGALGVGGFLLDGVHLVDGLGGRFGGSHVGLGLREVLVGLGDLLFRLREGLLLRGAAFERGLLLGEVLGGLGELLRGGLLRGLARLLQIGRGVAQALRGFGRNRQSALLEVCHRGF